MTFCWFCHDAAQVNLEAVYTVCLDMQDSDFHVSDMLDFSVYMVCLCPVCLGISPLQSCTMQAIYVNQIIIFHGL